MQTKKQLSLRAKPFLGSAVLVCKGNKPEKRISKFSYVRIKVKEFVTKVNCRMCVSSWKALAWLLDRSASFFYASIILRPISSLIRENRLISKCQQQAQYYAQQQLACDWEYRSGKRRHLYHLLIQHLPKHTNLRVERAKVSKLWRWLNHKQSSEQVADFIARTELCLKALSNFSSEPICTENKTSNLSLDEQSKKAARQRYEQLQTRLQFAFLCLQLEHGLVFDELSRVGVFVDYRELDYFELSEDEMWVAHYDILDPQSDCYFWVSLDGTVKITISQVYQMRIEELVYALNTLVNKV